MNLRGSGTREALLALLALLTVGVVFAALTRSSNAGSRAAPPPAVNSPTASTPSSAPVRALVVGAELVAGPAGAGLGDVLEAQLGWAVTTDAAPGTGFVAGREGQTIVDRLPAALTDAGKPDVVVLSSPPDAAETADAQLFGGNVAAAVDLVRQAQPEARVVLLAPVAGVADAFPTQRSVLQQVAARFGAYYMDATGEQWLAAPGLLENGQPTAQGFDELGRRFAAAARQVLPRSLAPEA